MDGYERAALRQEKARPVFDDLEVWLQAQLPRLSGKTKLAEAIRYALKPMPEARAYLGDGRLELDNNICERSIRPVAPGRKNCLFPSSVGGGEAAAIAYALIETAEMNNVDPEAWLTWVLERIADHRLTPSTNSCRGTGSPKTSKTRPDRTDTFELVEERLNDESVLQRQLFEYRPRVVLHVPATAGDRIPALFPEPGEEVF